MKKVLLDTNAYVSYLGGDEQVLRLRVADSLQVDVNVSHPAIDDILLSGFRTRYP